MSRPDKHKKQDEKLEKNPYHEVFETETENESLLNRDRRFLRQRKSNKCRRELFSTDKIT